jgi:hypothetical protein
MKVRKTMVYIVQYQKCAVPEKLSTRSVQHQKLSEPEMFSFSYIPVVGDELVKAVDSSPVVGLDEGGDGEVDVGLLGLVPACHL